VSSWTIIGLAVGGAVALVAVAVIWFTARRRGAAVSQSQEPEAPITRRELIDRGIIGFLLAALSGVVASAVAYASSSGGGSGGQRYAVGGLSNVRQRLSADRRPYVGGNGRFYVVPFPTERLAEAAKIYPPEVLAGMRQGLVALSPVCTHEACHVPYCASSAWFECPCHGSRYDGIGEQRRGPAPRGLDHFALSVVAGLVTVDTRRTYLGPPPGTQTLEDPPAGPHCF
jgi:cytochrome b6-f complex iron-sulfur subunit